MKGSFALLILLAVIATGHGQEKTLDKDRVFLELYKHVKAARPHAIVSDYFVVADLNLFYNTTKDYCSGVVIDREYLANSSLVDMFKTNLSRAYVLATEWKLEEHNPPIRGLYQPRGWTGFSQSLATVYEQKYNGYIILAEDIGPDNITTFFHEAIHCFAQAKGLGNLDEDQYDGPSFHSDNFLKSLNDLAAHEERLKPILEALGSGTNQDAELEKFWKRFELMHKDYFDRSNVTTFGVDLAEALKYSSQLHEAMGGKADWVGYELHLRRLIDEARARGDLAGGGGPTTHNGQPLKIGLLQCPTYSSSYELRTWTQDGETLQPGQVIVSHGSDKEHYTRCYYAVRGREYLAFGYEISWMEVPSELHNWCDREVGYTSMATKVNDLWRGPYTPHFNFGVTPDKSYAHRTKVATIKVKEFEKNFVRTYFGWSHLESTFEDIFKQIEPHAIPCETH